ncbi:MAG: hypothetical protein DMG95_12670 [Acidobacteria bacterium]|nr:MAG: hypothetical protein DMG95_12670 [Acidobacteriota bacterium]
MVRRCFLFAYRLLLQLYPPTFRHRFGAEMIELAEACEPNEWPLIFGDTSIAIVRCWIEGTHSPAAVTEPNAYVPIGESPVKVFGVLRGVVLTVAILAGVAYVNYRWPPPCPNSLFPAPPISASHRQH